MSNAKQMDFMSAWVKKANKRKLDQIALVLTREGISKVSRSNVLDVILDVVDLDAVRSIREGRIAKARSKLGGFNDPLDGGAAGTGNMATPQELYPSEVGEEHAQGNVG